MLEVEMKFPVENVAALERKLQDLGAGDPDSRTDVDQYFNAPDRDFGRTDEALRIRRIGPANFVTYKGPKKDLQTKTRTEIEVPLKPGDAFAEDFARLLENLGYRPVAIVRKKRRVYHLPRQGMAVEMCLDEVEGLGSFAELEIQSPEEQFEKARGILLETAQVFGLEKSERRSYLEMLLTSRSS